MSLSTFIADTIRLGTSDIVPYPDARKVVENNTNIHVHPAKYVISNESEYIPTCFLVTSILVPKINQQITEFPQLPLLYYEGTTSQDRLFNNYVSPSRNMKWGTLNTNKYSDYFFDNGFIIKGENVIYACCVEKDYVIERVNTTVDEIKEGAFYKRVIDKGFENHNAVDSLFRKRFIENFHKSDDIAQHMVIYSNPDEMQQLCDQMGCEYDNHFGFNSTWCQVRMIQDSMSEWFNSKIFTIPKTPSFDSIDGPEQYAQRVLGV